MKTQWNKPGPSLAGFTKQEANTKVVAKPMRKRDIWHESCEVCGAGPRESCNQSEHFEIAEKESHNG